MLVGTQMIAKGHDFPQVTLVGVISADVGLGLADFRAAERTFQLLTQVAGRAGRGEQSGEAIVQTLFPNHYSIQLATAQDYAAFFAKEIAYPPRDALSAGRRDGQRRRARAYPRRGDGGRRATRQAHRRRVEDHAGRFVVLGPAPAPLRRLRGDYRAQFFLKGPHARRCGSAVKQALTSLPELARKTSVDVDPLSVLCKARRRLELQLPGKSPSGAGVKQTISITSPTTAMMSRVRSSGISLVERRRMFGPDERRSSGAAGSSTPAIRSRRR